MAYFAIAGSLHLHPLAAMDGERVEILPQARVVAADPCVACLLARVIAEPGWAPAAVEGSFPSARRVMTRAACPAHEPSLGLVLGRAPPLLLAAAA
jgi:hypothetical protein